MNHILNQYLPFFYENSPFLSILGTFWHFWALFLFDQYQWFPDSWIELSFEMNQLIIFELNDILNWILGRAILNRILNEPFFGKIQTLNWIRLGIAQHYAIQFCINILVFVSSLTSILTTKISKKIQLFGQVIPMGVLLYIALSISCR